MNDRDDRIVMAILAALKTLDGYLVPEPVLHAEVNLRVVPNALLSEFGEALRTAESRRWIGAVRPKLGPTKWGLRDEGAAAYLELCK